MLSKDQGSFITKLLFFIEKKSFADVNAIVNDLGARMFWCWERMNVGRWVPVLKAALGRVAQHRHVRPHAGGRRCCQVSDFSIK